MSLKRFEDRSSEALAARSLIWKTGTYTEEAMAEYEEHDPEEEGNQKVRVSNHARDAVDQHQLICRRI